MYKRQSEHYETDSIVKPEVVMKDAAIKENALSGYAYEHPKLGEGRINSSAIISIKYDERATARIETKNTVFIVGPTGWSERPEDHPFNN